MHRCVIALALIALTGCSSDPPLVNAYSSAEAVAHQVLDALAARDRARLDALALDEQEFRDHVWPWLPAARPERNLPFAYVWGDLLQKSRSALTETLAQHGGRRYTLAAVEFAGHTDYGAFQVFRDTTLRVRDEAGGTRTIRVCGSMIEKDRTWKVFSYVVDE